MDLFNRQPPGASYDRIRPSYENTGTDNASHLTPFIAGQNKPKSRLNNIEKQQSNMSLASGNPDNRTGLKPKYYCIL